MVRHGQSQWQVNKDIEGWDSPLSTLGKLQAHHLGKYLAAYEEIDYIVASTLQRAQLTAEITASYLDLPVTLDADLREYERFSEGWAPGPVSAWEAAPLAERSPVYEEFRSRIERAMRNLVGSLEGEQTVLCVAHGGTIGVMLRILIGSDTPRIWSANTALHIVSWEQDAWTIHMLNQQEHLPLSMRTW
ncbi:MAG: histidine phosphatase family protein [Anaerolineae bacterium]|nr:histidine phosphatase family protein [Anaerolineae bacterium]